MRFVGLKNLSSLFTDTVLVGVSENASAPFTVISPADGVYVDDCLPTKPYCPGVYYMERAQPSIQGILQAGQPCSDLGPIDLDIPCIMPTTTTTTTTKPESTSTPCSNLGFNVTCTDDGKRCIILVLSIKFNVTMSLYCMPYNYVLKSI